MKTIFFITVLLLCILGLTSQQSDQLTQQQKDQIKKEIKAVFDSTIAKANRQDMDGFLQDYSSELVCVFDTSIFDYETYKKIWLNFPTYMTSWKWIPARFECIVLTNDFVVSTWIGKCEFFMKSGDKVTVNPRDYTNVFKRVGGQWKIIYEHSSSGIPVTEKADKK
jgi:ketosteroid isomerase-like protein